MITAALMVGGGNTVRERCKSLPDFRNKWGHPIEHEGRKQMDLPIVQKARANRLRALTVLSAQKNKLTAFGFARTRANPIFFSSRHHPASNATGTTNAIAATA